MRRDRIIPDPRLTLSEAISALTAANSIIEMDGDDAVLQSFVDKVVNACREYAARYPEDFAAVELEAAMRDRFRPPDEDPNG